MGLFGTKKEEKQDLPPLQFPELPRSVPQFDMGKSAEETQEIKNAVASPGYNAVPMTESQGQERPLFIKIDRYRAVVDTLNKLKKELSEADAVLQRLDAIKEQEARELSAWHSDLERIRGQLLDIDKKLFE